MATVVHYAVLVIAPVCVIISIILGSKSVRQLRKRTGDDSALTGILGLLL
jgi:hypothetical protein